MPRTVVTTQSPTPIPVIQGAYEWLRAEAFGREVRLDAQWPYSSGDVGKFTEHPSPLGFTSHITIPTDPSIEEWLKFQVLLEQWHAERGAMSSITEMSLCPSYQNIIGMGSSAIPFILGELKAEGQEPDQWFWALRAITGESPVPEELQGDYVQMARCWLDWGMKNGHVG
jgi:hypothetical protein